MDKKHLKPKLMKRPMIKRTKPQNMNSNQVKTNNYKNKTMTVVKKILTKNMVKID